MRFQLIVDEGADYDGWLLWLLHHRGGQYILHDGDRDRAYIIKKAFKKPTIKRVILTVLLWTPKLFVQPIYLIYWTIKDMQYYRGNRRSNVLSRTLLLLKRLRANYEFAKTLRRH